ncbi:MAG: PKD domain-containing protein [Solirubrobacterales bacterium]
MSGRRPHLAGRFAGLIAVGVALLAAAAVGPVGSALADAPQVTIVTPGGTQHTLALEALAGSEDVVDQTYALRSEAGESTTTVTGFSIAALLEAAGVDPYGFSYLEVERPSGGSVQLSSAQALDSSPAPVVYGTAAGTGFIRPSGGAGDDNAGDSFEAPQGLTITLRKGSSLQVRIEASPRSTKVGKKVHFRAVVERAGSGEQLTYSWYFDDGNSGSGATAVHSFGEPGSYAVVVGVKAAGESTGTSAVVRIQVGKAAGGGPDRQGGGTNKSANAPDSGVADGSSGSAEASTTPSEGSASAGTATAGAGAAAKQARKSKAKTRSAKASQKEKQATEAAPEASGEEVSGELLEGEAEAEPEVTRGKQVAARTGTPRADDGDGGGGVPGAAIGLGAVVALLGAGALAEAGAFTDLIPRTLGRLR